MFPILFKIGPFTIYSYGLAMAVAALVCAYLLAKDAARHKISKDTVFDFLFTCVLWGILGARLFYVILYWPSFAENLWEIPMLQNGGLSWQGGFIAGTISGLWFIRSRKLPLLLWLDLIAPYIALGQAIGRVGCFFNGCCYGKPASWGIFFPVHNAQLHPTQLYETAALLLIFFLLKNAMARPHRAGSIFVFYLWLAAIERFTVEFFRADHDVLYFGLSLFQWVACGIFMAGLIVWTRLKQK